MASGRHNGPIGPLLGGEIKIKIIVHQAEEGGFWAEVPGLPGCFSQGETAEELEANIREAIEGYFLAVNMDAPTAAGARVVEVAV